MIKSVDVILNFSFSSSPYRSFPLCWHFRFSLMSRQLSLLISFFLWFWSDFTVLLTLCLRVIFGIFMNFSLSLFVNNVFTYFSLKRRKMKKKKNKNIVLNYNVALRHVLMWLFVFFSSHSPLVKMKLAKAHVLPMREAA